MNKKNKIVIVEDNDECNNRVAKYIDNIIEKKNYEIVVFKKYNKELQDIIFDNNIKIFIIDLVLGIGPNKGPDGYEICEIIRDEANDWYSNIIIMSVHNFQNDIFSQRLGILTYIQKDNSFEMNIKIALKKAYDIIENNFLFKINSIAKTSISEICYVKKELESKYCLIMTFYGEFRQRTALKSINEKLHFKQLNDHLLINERNVIFMSKELIVFKNNIQINPNQI